MIEFVSTLQYIGLILDIIGAGLLWHYGITATIDHPEFNLAMKKALVVGEKEENDQIVRDSKKQIKVVRKWSQFGLALLVVGFLLQIVGSYTSSVTISNLGNENIALELKLITSNSNTKKKLEEYEKTEKDIRELKILTSQRFLNLIEIYKDKDEKHKILEAKLFELNREFNKVKDEHKKMSHVVNTPSIKFEVRQ